MFLANKYKEIPALRAIFILLCLTVLVVFPTVRALEVGTDTENYRDMFVYKRHVGLSVADFIGGIEPGFVIFQKIMQSLTENFTTFLFSIALFIVSIYLYLTKKISENFGISMFVFISLGIYIFFFNGARQAMAAAVYGFAILPLIRGNFVKYALFVILAASFHKTVIIMLPLYFVFRQKISLKQMVILVIATTLVTSGLSIVMSVAPGLVNEKYSDYHNRTSGGGVLLMVAYIVMNAAFFFSRKLIKEEDLPKYDIFLNFTMFTAIVYIVVNLGGQDVNLIRFTLYSSFGFIFIWPLLFKNLGLFKSIVPWVFFYTIHIVFYYVYIEKMIGPYRLNPAFA